MSLLHKFTIKNLKLNKKRTIVTMIGIMLSVALVTSVAFIYNSGVQSLIHFETYMKGNFHVAYYNVPSKDLELFQNNKEIEDVYLTKNLGYASIPSKNESKPYAYVKAFTKSSLENLSIRLVEGRLPLNDHEIVIPTHLKTNGRLELKVGSSITLNIGNRLQLDDQVEMDQSNPLQENEKIINQKSKTYEIVGIIERPATNIESYSAPGYTFITFMNENDFTGNFDVYAHYTKDGIKNAYPLTARILEVNESLFEKYYKGTATYQEMEQYMEETKEKYDFNINTYLIDLETNPLEVSSISGLATTAIIVILIIVFTSVFCIKNSFDISITEKIKQYGMLRSIGATKKQIRRNVFYEATILGLVGIPLGILLGLFASFILILVSNYFLKDLIAVAMNLQFSFSLLPILVAILLGIITIYFSAFHSARKASLISPIDSIRSSASIKIPSKKLQAPKFISKLFGIGGEISYKNLKRNKKKYRTTVISLVVSVSVFLALSSFMSLAFDVARNELNISEYNVFLYSSSVDNEKLFQKYLKTTSLENIEEYSVLRSMGFDCENRRLSSQYQKFLDLPVDEDDNTQYLPIYALGDEPFQKYVRSLGLSYDEVKDKGILMDYMKVSRIDESKKKMVYETMRLTDFKEGDTLLGTLNNGKDVSLQLGAVTSSKPFGLKNYDGIYLIVSDEVYEKLLGSDPSKIVSIYFKSNQANQLQDDIDEVLKGENYTIDNMEENVAMMDHLFTLIGIFLYGFIIVIILIGITNIFNTITTNIELRRPEFAMLKSIGMTSSEFNRMIRLETFFMGIKSLIFGIPIGLCLSYLIYYFLGKNLGIPYKVPIVAIVISIVVLFLLISIIMKYSMNKIRKQNTIETIRNENI